MPFRGLFMQKKQKNPIFQFSKVKVIFQDMVLLTPSNVPGMFRWNNQNRLGEKCEKAIFLFKMAAISRNPEHLCQNFAPHSTTTKSMCMQNIVRTSPIMRALEPAQRLKHTFFLQQQQGPRQLQRYKKHIGPILHVGPNKNIRDLCIGP